MLINLPTVKKKKNENRNIEIQKNTIFEKLSVTKFSFNGDDMQPQGHYIIHLYLLPYLCLSGNILESAFRLNDWQ